MTDELNKDRKEDQSPTEATVSMIELIGYLRKDDDDNVLLISLSKDSIEKAETYKTKQGKDFIRLFVNIDKVMDIINKHREVISICQMREY